MTDETNSSPSGNSNDSYPLTNNRKNTLPRFNRLYDLQIADQQKYFKWYFSLPLISAIIIFVLTGIGTIVGLIFVGALALAIITIPGVILGVLEFSFGRILLSQKILTVLYLQKLNEDKE